MQGILTSDSMLSKLRAIWQLTRLEHGIMFGLGVVIGIVVSDTAFLTSYNVLLGLLTAVMIEAGTFALNDYYDLEVDRANKRVDRPLVRGDLSPKIALVIALLLTPIGVLASILLNWICFFIALISALFGVFYDVKLKETGFPGNIYIAYSMAIPFIFGGAITGKLPFVLWLLALIAFLSGLGREIMKGAMDVEGDALRNVRSVARIYGEKRAAHSAGALFIIGIILSLIPYFYAEGAKYYQNEIYLIPVLLSDLLFAYTSFNLLEKYSISTVKQMRSITLLAIFLGLIAFLMGALFTL